MEHGKIVYLSGKITDNENYKRDFASAECFLAQMGYIVLNPANLEEVGKGLVYEKYLSICYRLIDVAEIIFMVSGWQKSKGANAELSYAKSLGKKVMYQDYYAPFRKVNENDMS
jgi:hypothetical protein